MCNKRQPACIAIELYTVLQWPNFVTIRLSDHYPALTAVWAWLQGVHGAAQRSGESMTWQLSSAAPAISHLPDRRACRRSPRLPPRLPLPHTISISQLRLLKEHPLPPRRCHAVDRPSRRGLSAPHPKTMPAGERPPSTSSHPGALLALRSQGSRGLRQRRRAPLVRLCVLAPRPVSGVQNARAATSSS